MAKVKPRLHILYLFFLSACIAPGALKTPAQDHYVQAQVAADKCRAESCGDELQEILEEFVEQSKCILAIVEGERCSDDA